MIDISTRLLYASSPEIYAAVKTVSNIAQAYVKRAVEEPEAAREDLRDNLIVFFAQYDRMRTDEIESLKVRLQEALQHAIIPIKSGTVK